MYKAHKFILSFSIVAAWTGSFFLKIDFTPIASAGIDLIAICTAVYLAVYPAIQGNQTLCEKLNKQDKKIRNKSEIGVLNTYIIVGLILGLISIIAFCALLVINDRNKAITDLIAAQSHVAIWHYCLSSTCYALFAADLVQIFWIGRFIVNRVTYNS